MMVVVAWTWNRETDILVGYRLRRSFPPAEPVRCSLPPIRMG